MESLSHYDFSLPEELIATFPVNDRSASRLLVLRAHDASPLHDCFNNIGNYLRAGDVLVVNNTKVMKARIKAFKATGGRVEILLVRPLPHGAWLALINGKGPFLPTTQLYLSDNNSDVVTIMGKNTLEQGAYELFSETDLGSYAEAHGELPLPPYFKRAAQAEDDVWYQTVYAKELGAVAAPTAGLHFTEELLSDLASRSIEKIETTLHVGPGTFLPIRTETIADHKMHAEFFRMDTNAADKLNRAKKEGRRIIAVGSTAMRVLETVMGRARAQNLNEFFACDSSTDIFIRPGYQFVACDAMITNFHLPRSTLLLLISAFAGHARVLRAYEEAIAQRYRFFSYGDACFFELWKSQ